MRIQDVLVWMVIGMAMLVIQYGIYRFLLGKGYAGRRALPLNALGLLANLLIIFALAWAYQSIIEGEFQAAGMGLVFFGGASLIPAIITWRLAIRKSKPGAEGDEGNRKSVNIDADADPELLAATDAR
ncbi:MAG: hypothetical protein LBK67_06815 [Coriobacteriales bacterium]|jgi:hypothetical protein|nr:hypothetical protein [Coriobacteriales bacterium]